MLKDRINPNSGKYIEPFQEGTIGSYFGMTVGAPTVASNACTLVENQINSPVYTGAAALAAALPAAKAGARLVLNLADDSAGGTAALTINCAGSDVWEQGCVVPTTSSNKVTYDVSAKNETALALTPTNNTTNLFSFGSTIEFVCERDGYWYVQVGQIASDIGVTAGAATGTLLFAA